MSKTRNTSLFLATILSVPVFIFFCHKTVYTPQESLRVRRNQDILGRPRCRTRPLTSSKQFLQYFRNVQYQCQNLTGFGKRFYSLDGLKFVCLDSAFEMQRNNCTVLSFGINNEWEFEDDMAAMGCTIHAFDPTMNRNDYKRSDNIYFYNLGLGDGRAKRNIGMDDNIEYFQVDSYEHILEQLGLLDAPIHYLKMDIELSELEFLRDALRNSPHLLQNVRQLAIEIHHGMKGEGVHKQVPMAGELSPTSTFPLFWQHFQELHCLGFRLIYSRANLPWHEVLWGRPAVH